MVVARKKFAMPTVTRTLNFLALDCNDENTNNERVCKHFDITSLQHLVCI